MSEISKIIGSFESISLKESAKVEFMKRCDKKYVISYSSLVEILNVINEDYFVMAVVGNKTQSYITTYYDTDSNYFYLCHHNGKNNRLKVRKREYLTSGERYFEVKRKSLSGYCTKKRCMTDTGLSEALCSGENSFLIKHNAFQDEELKPVISTVFSRITLVSRKFNERVTIDTDLSFEDLNGGRASLNNLAIVEVKCNKHNDKTPIQKRLREHNAHSNGFSKYCVGRTMLDENLKRNNFKSKLQLIKNI